MLLSDITGLQTRTRAIARAARVAAPVFVNEGWTWPIGYGGETRIPTQDEIVASLDSDAEHLLAEPDVVGTGSGRFFLEREEPHQPWEAITINLRLGSWQLHPSDE